jgi:Family of unknown function (DUF6111)
MGGDGGYDPHAVGKALDLMWRIVLDALLIFVIPFALFAMWQAFAQKDPRAALQLERGPAAWLTLAGLLMVILSIAAWELTSTPHTGGYSRAIWKDGKLIPAEVK